MSSVEGLAYPSSWAGPSGVMQICMRVLGFKHCVGFVSD